MNSRKSKSQKRIPPQESAVDYTLDKITALPYMDGRIKFRVTQRYERLRFAEHVLLHLDDEELREVIDPKLYSKTKQGLVKRTIQQARDYVFGRIKIEQAIFVGADHQSRNTKASGGGRGANLSIEEIDWVCEKWDADLPKYPDSGAGARYARIAKAASEEFGYPWKPRRVKSALESRAER